MATDIHSGYAPDTENPQYALMQKIMTLAKPWCDHTEGFESGLRVGTCLWTCVGRCSQVHGDDEYGPDFSQKQSAFGTCANSTALRAALLQCVTPLETLERIRRRHLEVERVRTITGSKLTLSREARERTKVKTNTREVIARPARPTRALQTSTRENWKTWS